MILTWMLYSVVIGLLLSVGAWCLEHGLRQRGWPVRWVWAASLLGSVALPAVGLLLPARVDFPLSPGVREASVMGVVQLDPLAPVLSAVQSTSASLDGMLLGFWMAASALVLLGLVWSQWQLHERWQSWPSRRVDGRQLLVSPDTGPAVFGLITPRIVLPEWILEREASERALILAHEEEHIRAEDPRLLGLALLPLVALPWNLPLWWQWQRLRHAVELDCDRRVLARGAEIRAYCRVLLDVKTHGFARRLLIAAVSDSPSSLEQRIRAMLTPKIPRWTVLSSSSAVLAAAVFLVAFRMTPPVHSTEVGNAAFGLQAMEAVPSFQQNQGSTPTDVVTTETDLGAMPAVELEPAPRVVLAAVDTPSVTDDFAYEVARLDMPPRLDNVPVIIQEMARLYPITLRNAGISGRVVMQLTVQPDGSVDPESVGVIESSHEAFEAPSIEIVEIMQFRPGLLRGNPVRVLIQMPIAWVGQP